MAWLTIRKNQNLIKLVWNVQFCCWVILFVVCSDCRVVRCSEAWWWRVWRRWRFTTKMKFIRSWREDRPRGGRRPRSWTPTPGKLSSAERSHLWMISVTFTTFYVRLAFGLFTIFPSCVSVKSLPLRVLSHHPHEGDHSGWRGAGEDRQTQSGNYSNCWIWEDSYWETV